MKNEWLTAKKSTELKKIELMLSNMLNSFDPPQKNFYFTISITELPLYSLHICDVFQDYSLSDYPVIIIVRTG
jgi:hypothetical protein